MKSLHTQVFWRDVTGNSLDADMASLQADVAAFTATFTNQSDIRGIDTSMASATVFNERHTFVMMTVIYLE